MPTHATQPSLEEIREVGEILFTQFARQRLNQAGVYDDEILPGGEEEEAFSQGVDNRDHDLYHDLNGTNCTELSQDRLTEERASDIDRLVEARPILASYGRELRRIAEQFEQTRLRQQIKMRANEVNRNDHHDISPA